MARLRGELGGALHRAGQSLEHDDQRGNSTHFSSKKQARLVGSREKTGHSRLVVTTSLERKPLLSSHFQDNKERRAPHCEPRKSRR